MGAMLRVRPMTGTPMAAPATPLPTADQDNLTDVLALIDRLLRCR